MMRSYGILGCPVFDLFSDHRRQIRRVGGSREPFPATWPGGFPLQRTELNFMAMSQGNRMVTDLPGFSHCVSHAQIKSCFFSLLEDILKTYGSEISMLALLLGR